MTHDTSSEFARATAVERLSDHHFHRRTRRQVEGRRCCQRRIPPRNRRTSIARPQSDCTPDPLGDLHLLPRPKHEKAPSTSPHASLREGRSTANYGIELSQNGAPTISSMATMGNLGALPDDVATTATNLRTCRHRKNASVSPKPAKTSTNAAPIIDRFDMRLDPATAGFAVGKAERKRTAAGLDPTRSMTLTPNRCRC
jgi:hypothetical protein